MASIVTINGQTIISSGNNITVSNGKIMIDGKDFTPDAKVINIEVNGNVDKIDVDCCEKVTISGDANTVSSHNGNIDIGGRVSGSVTTHNGDIDCQDVGGSATTKNGNIKHRK